MPHPPDNTLIAHYQVLLDHYGPGYRAVQWSSIDAQIRRFAVLSEVVEPSASVMDVGCGLGDLLSYLRDERRFVGRYLGLDFVPEFIEHASRQHAGDEQASFRVFDARYEGFPRGYDLILISGTFNNLITDPESHLEWMQTTLERAFSAAEIALAFNGLSTMVERDERELFYSDPGDMFSWCAARLTRKLSLRHDYNASPALDVPVDYTIFLYK